jgi:hypothetical protein
VSNSVFLYGLLFLFLMIFLAGGGIGLVIGFVLGSREDKPAGSPLSLQPTAVESTASQAVEAAAKPSFSDLLRSEQAHPEAIASESVVPTQAVPIVPLPPRRVQSWTIALAVTVMLVCCVCVFLVAALITARQ